MFCDSYTSWSGQSCVNDTQKWVRRLRSFGFFSGLIGAITGNNVLTFASQRAIVGVAVIYAVEGLYKLILSPPWYGQSGTSDGLIPTSSQRWQNAPDPQGQFFLDGRVEANVPTHNIEQTNDAVRRRLRIALLERMLFVERL
jgi:hypothetical protein